MIKVILVRLDGDDQADGLRLAAARDLAQIFDAFIAGLFINVLPMPVIPPDGTGADYWTRLMIEAREAGDVVAATLRQRLAELNRPVELRRFDVFGDDVGRICARETRAADVFLTLRPHEQEEVERQDVIEDVLFRGGRHLFLVSESRRYESGFSHAVIAWNGSREVARALSEARPYLHQARRATVLVVDRDVPIEIDALVGEDAVGYLKHHGIEAGLHRARKHKTVSDTIIGELGTLGADLLIMGGYGSSRLAEWLLGGTTRIMLRRSPVPLVIAH